MATVTVLKFPTADGAHETLNIIYELKKQHLIKLHDAAIVYWPMKRPSHRSNQLFDLVGAGAMGGVFWGLLFRFIFAAPFFGLAIGAALGALGGAMRDYGIDDDFIQRVRSQVTEGTSALFPMTSEAVMDRVVEALKDVKFEIIATNLSAEQEQKLRDAFGRE
jgi:uncharacterized membrane protein